MQCLECGGNGNNTIAYQTLPLQQFNLPCKFNIFTNNASSLAPGLVIEFKEGWPGESLLIKEANMRNVKTTDQMNPASCVSLLVNASNIGTHLTLRIWHTSHASFTKPRLCACRACIAANTTRLLYYYHEHVFMLQACWMTNWLVFGQQQPNSHA